MGKTILAVNAGSSSVSITLFKWERPPATIATAKVAGITAPPQIFKYSRGAEEKNEEIEDKLGSPQEAFKYLLDRFLNDSDLQVIRDKSDFAYICHRVVHGGDLEDAVLIDKKTNSYLHDLKDLAPLHNTASLDIIQTCLKEIPGVKITAYFDTTFHSSLPDYVRNYPIDPEKAKSNWLRKYGFHGISYSFVLRSVAEFLKKPPNSTNLITLHLGSGASVCAIRSGKSVDTSMGLTPLSGLPGATRSGDVDPSLVFHYTSVAGKLSPASTKDMHLSVAEEILNKKSGWKALTGTADFSQIATENPPTDKHRLAFDIFVDRIVGLVGNYAVKLDGNVDALVFAGGIGEKSPLLRKAVVEKCRCLGFAINQEANSRGPEKSTAVTDISEKRGQSPAVLICQTNEEFEMAYQCVISPP